MLSYPAWYLSWMCQYKVTRPRPMFATVASKDIHLNQGNVSWILYVHFIVSDLYTLVIFKQWTQLMYVHSYVKFPSLKLPLFWLTNYPKELNVQKIVHNMTIFNLTSWTILIIWKDPLSKLKEKSIKFIFGISAWEKIHETRSFEIGEVVSNRVRIVLLL